MSTNNTLSECIYHAFAAAISSKTRFNEMVAAGVSERSFCENDPNKFIFLALKKIYKDGSASKLDPNVVKAKAIDIASESGIDPTRVILYENKIFGTIEACRSVDLSLVDIEFACDNIRADSIRRNISERLKEMSEDLDCGKKNSGQAVKGLGELQISVAREIGIKSKVSTVKDMKSKIISDLTTEIDPPTTTGFPGIDEALLGGLQNSYLVYVAGRPGMAKTQILINMMIRAAEAGKKCLFMTYELPAPFIVKRILAYKSQLSLGQLIGGLKCSDKVSPEQLADLERVIDSFNENVFVCDAAGMNIAESAAFVRGEIESKGIGAAYFDYVQIIRTPDGRVPEKESDFASISFILRELAASCNIPVVAAAQLNREVRKRKNKRPCLSDLRSSGSLENDARVVIGLYRDEYYNKYSEEKDILEMSILKNTNGELITTKNFFNKPKCTILELDDRIGEAPAYVDTEQDGFYGDKPQQDLFESGDDAGW